MRILKHNYILMQTDETLFNLKAVLKKSIESYKNSSDSELNKMHSQLTKEFLDYKESSEDFYIDFCKDYKYALDKIELLIKQLAFSNKNESIQALTIIYKAVCYLETRCDTAMKIRRFKTRAILLAFNHHFNHLITFDVMRNEYISSDVKLAVVDVLVNLNIFFSTIIRYLKEVEDENY